MLIVQDPGDTTPHQTGRLCAVHNAENPSDKTAQQALHLWNAAVSLDHHNPSAGGYLESAEKRFFKSPKFSSSYDWAGTQTTIDDSWHLQLA